ncbi:MAG: amidohydrolase [Bacteroidetes bacterium]|nr:amidohydrolase [Bacteroidota bacterium]MDA0873445.1 amidohydrolase [Bacteroidota bacterium]
MHRVLLLCTLFLAGCSAQQPDGYLVVDAVIYTMDDSIPVAEAMAVVDGKVAMIGHADDVRAAHPALPERSLGGKTVVPGFTDSHGHFMSLGFRKIMVDLRGSTSIEEVIQRIQAFFPDLEEGEWIRGRGWNQVLWPGQEFPTRQDLDAYFPNNPVALERIDGHASWYNTAAMNIAGFESIQNAEDPVGGAIIRDANGVPTGVFIDAAAGLVERHVPAWTQEETEDALTLALQEAAEMGLTGIHDAGVDQATIDLYKRFIDEDRFTVRMYAMIGGTRGSAFRTYCNNPIIDYGDRLSVRSVKLYLDGALGSRGAALLEDYSDEAGNRGLLFAEPEEFAAQVRESVACGYQVNTHAIGDRGNRVLLESYELAGITPESRPRDEHTQIIALEDVPRFQQLGIIASMQPTHATSDLNMAEDRLGPHRIKGGYAWRTLTDAGIPLAFGSDFPVEKSNPIDGFFAGVTRQTKDLLPEGGWYPEERLTREETLAAFTKGGAYAAFQEDQLGSLSPGKFADFVVLSADIMTVPPPQIIESKVEATFFGGQLVFGPVPGE